MLLWFAILFAAIAEYESAMLTNKVKRVQVRELSSCEDAQDLAFVVLTTRLDIVGRGKMAMNAVGAARKRIELPDKMQVRLFQCRSFIEPETCEYNSRRKYNNPLDGIYEPNRTWTEIVKSISPKIVFPLNKGRYMMRNATLDIDAKYVHNLPAFEGSYWKIRTDLFLSKERVFCIVIGAEIIQLKQTIGDLKRK